MKIKILCGNPKLMMATLNLDVSCLDSYDLYLLRFANGVKQFYCEFQKVNQDEFHRAGGSLGPVLQTYNFSCFKWPETRRFSVYTFR